MLELEGAGHFPHAEKPDIVFPAIEEFLRERTVR
ncbi:MAG: alpha/beta fold hydrolase [Thermoanaerobaculia bacterium]